MSRDFARARERFIFALLSATGAAALFGAALLVAWMQPDIQSDQKTPRHLPRPAQTRQDAPAPLPVVKQDLIIQQNSECWTGVPGLTCDEGIRTYA